MSSLRGRIGTVRPVVFDNPRWIERESALLAVFERMRKGSWNSGGRRRRAMGYGVGKLIRYERFR